MVEKKGVCDMKAGIFFTGSGPLVILTSYDSFTNPNLNRKSFRKNIYRHGKDTMI
jgi:hypothetical protein